VVLCSTSRRTLLAPTVHHRQTTRLSAKGTLQSPRSAFNPRNTADKRHINSDINPLHIYPRQHTTHPQNTLQVIQRVPLTPSKACVPPELFCAYTTIPDSLGPPSFRAGHGHSAEPVSTPPSQLWLRGRPAQPGKATSQA